MFFFFWAEHKKQPIPNRIRGIHFFIKSIEDKQLMKGNILIATDSMKLASTVQQMSISPAQLEIDMHDITIINDIYVTHISRALNMVADNLAKEGGSRGILIAGWCN